MAISKDIRRVIISVDGSVPSSIVRSYSLEDTIGIPFSVDAKLAFDQIGIKCFFPDEVVDLPDLNLFGIENSERVRAICDFLDKRLIDEIPWLAENGIRLMSFSFYRVKTLLDAILSSFLILERLFEEIGSREVIVARNLCSPSIEQDIVVGLLENVFYNKGNIQIKTYTQWDIIGVCLSKVKNFARNRLANFRNGWGKKNAKECVIVLQKDHDISFLGDDVLGEIRFHLIGPSFFPSIDVTGENRLACQKLIEKTFAEAALDPAYRRLYPDNDNLYRFANLLLRDNVVNKTASYLPAASNYKDLICALNPKFAITSSCRFNFSEAFFYGIVRSMGIPIVAYQEGGGLGYLDWPLFNLDTELSDFFLVYGEGVKKSKYLKKEASEIVSVGSPRLEHIKRSIRKTRKPEKTVMIITNNINSVWQHYPYNGGLFSRAYKQQVRIIETVKKFVGFRFVLKTVKGKGYLYKGFAGAVCIETRPLADILGEADAFILEYPSTVLQECLLTDKPIAILYNDESVKFEASARELLMKRVRMNSNPAEFFQIIAALLDDIKNCPEMTKNNEFRDSYCLMQDTSKRADFFQGLLKK